MELRRESVWKGRAITIEDTPRAIMGYKNQALGVEVRMTGAA